MRSIRIVAGVLLLTAVIVAPFVSSRGSHVDISGKVYERDDAVDNLRPVAGAVVSNDWDSTTATTDAQCEYRVRVRRVAADEFIKFTAHVGERAGCHQRVGSGSRTVDIILNHPAFEHCRPD